MRSEIIHGDCLEVMRTMEANSVDLIVTDPPYGLSSITHSRVGEEPNPYRRVQCRTGFMGKEWDVLPAADIWRECSRVLKPGAFAFVMCTPRQDSLLEMLLRIREAGFMLASSSIYWCYAQGFPKATNIGKKIDARLGKEREITGENPQYCTGRKPYILGQGAGNDRPWLHEPQAQDFRHYLTAPASPEAAMFEDWMPASSFKPACEVIIVAQKPLSEKTYADQAIKSLKDPSVAPGCLNMGAGRIPHSEASRTCDRQLYGGQTWNDGNTGLRRHPNALASPASQGRFPANLIVEDDALNDGRVTKSACYTTPASERQVCHSTKGFTMGPRVGQGYPDSGSFSRFFSLDAWFAERLKELPESVQRTFPFLICPKPSKSEKNKGCMDLPEQITDCLKGNKDGTPNKRTKGKPTKCRNTNPCVKPLKLMAYLITLGSREGQLVLDPFCGSGTTGVAAAVLGRRFVGIEAEAEYVAIAEARIKTTPQRHREHRARKADEAQASLCSPSLCGEKLQSTLALEAIA